MLNNKKATPQLLRLAAWSDQYSFEIKHIKRKDNVIPDYLSRFINSQPEQPQNPSLVIPFIPSIYTMTSSSSSPSTHTPSPVELRLITHNVPRSAPPDAISIIVSKTPKQKAINRAIDQQLTLIRQSGNDFINNLTFHPEYPFLKVYSIPQHFECPIQFIHMLWYLASVFTIALEVDIISLLINYKKQPLHRPVYQTIIDLLSWFQLLRIWEQVLTIHREKIPKHRNPNSLHPDSLILPSEYFAVFFLSLHPHYNKTLRVISLRPSINVYDTSALSLNNLECSRPIQKRLCEINSIIPEEYAHFTYKFCYIFFL